MAILFTKNFKVDFGSKYSDSDGRILLCNIQVKDKKFHWLQFMHQQKTNQNLPTKNEPKFFDNFFSILSNFSIHDVILAGNWNLVLNDRLDKNGGSFHHTAHQKNV